MFICVLAILLMASEPPAGSPGKSPTSPSETSASKPAPERPPIPKASLGLQDRARAYFARARAAYARTTSYSCDIEATTTYRGVDEPRREQKPVKSSITVMGKRFRLGPVNTPSDWWCDGLKAIAIVTEDYFVYPVTAIEHQRKLFEPSASPALQIVCVMTGFSAGGGTDFGLESFLEIRAENIDGRPGVWVSGKRKITSGSSRSDGLKNPVPDRVAVWLDDETGMIGQVLHDRSDAAKALFDQNYSKNYGLPPGTKDRSKRSEMIEDRTVYRLKNAKNDATIQPEQFKAPIEGKHEIKPR